MRDLSKIMEQQARMFLKKREKTTFPPPSSFNFQGIKFWFGCAVAKTSSSTIMRPVSVMDFLCRGDRLLKAIYLNWKDHSFYQSFSEWLEVGFSSPEQAASLAEEHFGRFRDFSLFSQKMGFAEKSKYHESMLQTKDFRIMFELYREVKFFAGEELDEVLKKKQKPKEFYDKCWWLCFWCEKDGFKSIEHYVPFERASDMDDIFLTWLKGACSGVGELFTQLPEKLRGILVETPASLKYKEPEVRWRKSL